MPPQPACPPCSPFGPLLQFFQPSLPLPRPSRTRSAAASSKHLLPAPPAPPTHPCPVPPCRQCPPAGSAQPLPRTRTPRVCFAKTPLPLDTPCPISFYSKLPLIVLCTRVSDALARMCKAAAGGGRQSRRHGQQHSALMNSVERGCVLQRSSSKQRQAHRRTNAASSGGCSLPAALGVRCRHALILTHQSRRAVDCRSVAPPTS